MKKRLSKGKTLVVAMLLSLVVGALVGFGVTLASFEPSDTAKDGNGTVLTIGTEGPRS